MEKKKKFYYLLGIILLIFVIDYFYGQIGEIKSIRNQYKKFNSEISNLKINTNNLIPNITHYYEEILDNKSLQDKNKIHTFRTDEFGTILPNNKNDNNLKIIFLGGSTTESNEVSENLRYPVIVQKNLKERGLNIHSINAGIRGHTTIDSINTLINR